MDEFNIPLFKKIYELYKELYLCIKNFPKQDKYSLGIRMENLTTDLLQQIFQASQVSREEKLPLLKQASTTLNLIRVAIRLAKDIRALDIKKYIFLQLLIDEIGRMIDG